MTEQTKPKVTRRKIGYQVQIRSANGDERWQNDGQPHDKLPVAIKCGKSRTEDGEQFQVVRVIFGPVTKKTTTTTKVVLE